MMKIFHASDLSIIFLLVENYQKKRTKIERKLEDIWQSLNVLDMLLNVSYS